VFMMDKIFKLVGATFIIVLIHYMPAWAQQEAGVNTVITIELERMRPDGIMEKKHSQQQGIFSEEELETIIEEGNNDELLVRRKVIVEKNHPDGKVEKSTYYFDRNTQQNQSFERRFDRQGPFNRQGEPGFLFRLPEADFYYKDMVPDFTEDFLDKLPEMFESFNFSAGRVRLGVSTATNNEEGVIVKEVFPNSIAEEAGVLSGDIIVSVDNTPVNGPAELRNLIQSKKEGDTFLLGILRNGSEMKIAVTARAANPFMSFGQNMPIRDRDYFIEKDSFPKKQRKSIFHKKEDSKVRLGVTVERMVNYKGLKIVDISPDSPAHRAGLQKFDIIEKFDKHKLNDPKQLQSLVTDKVGEEVKLTIRREGKKIKKKVRLE